VPDLVHYTLDADIVVTEGTQEVMTSDNLAKTVPVLAEHLLKYGAASGAIRWRCLSRRIVCRARHAKSLPVFAAASLHHVAGIPIRHADATQGPPCLRRAWRVRHRSFE